MKLHDHDTHCEDRQISNSYVKLINRLEIFVLALPPRGILVAMQAHKTCTFEVEGDIIASD